MRITAFRIVKSDYAASAFDGQGAKRYGGRWNNKGTAVVYTSDSLALCTLEIVVHLPSYDLLNSYSYIPVEFDATLVKHAKLRDGWDDRPFSGVSQSIGEHWVRGCKSPVLKVPSVIVPDGNNYLINVSHQDFSRIRTGEPVPFQFDPRLRK